MDVKEIKKELRKELGMWIGGQQKVTAEFIKDVSTKFFDNMELQGKGHVDKENREKIISAICEDFLGFGPLNKLMEDEEITEIMVNGPYRIYIEKDGRKVICDVKFDDEAHLRNILEKMLTPVHRRVDETSPYVDFALPNGSRVNIILPPLAIGGAVVTIRKFLQSIHQAEDLVKMGTIDERMAEFLVACIKAKINMLFSGATGSGKTTTLEVLSYYIDHHERIITIEDALELSLRQDHVVRLLTRPPNIEGKGEVTPRDLFRNTLRMRPTKIILGEIRGAEAMDYLQALNSGHRGCLGVIHASSPRDALTRLETMALYAGLNIPSWAIRGQISSGLELIVQQEQLLDGTRKITHLTEVGDLKDNEVILHDLFRYEISGVDEDRKVIGKFKAYGKPSFFPIFQKKGIRLSENIFVEK
jgi:pilus assembly protein CpaF